MKISFFLATASLYLDISRKIKNKRLTTRLGCACEAAFFLFWLHSLQMKQFTAIWSLQVNIVRVTMGFIWPPCHRVSCRNLQNPVTVRKVQKGGGGGKKKERFFGFFFFLLRESHIIAQLYSEIGILTHGLCRGRVPECMCVCVCVRACARHFKLKSVKSDCEKNSAISSLKSKRRATGSAPPCSYVQDVKWLSGITPPAKTPMKAPCLSSARLTFFAQSPGFSRWLSTLVAGETLSCEGLLPSALRRNSGVIKYN